jgi:8-oxo-dGTP pyrophosphatase MutT (NUDIX family)
MKPIRNSAKAVIIQNKRLLTNKLTGIDEVYYTLPGGGQEKGETLHETLRRECLEEINIEVEIGDLLFIREYLGWNHEFALYDGDSHQVEFMFAAGIQEGQIPSVGSKPDTGQLDIEWIPLDSLKDIPFYPQALKPLLENGYPEKSSYLGDVN